MKQYGLSMKKIFQFCWLALAILSPAQTQKATLHIYRPRLSVHEGAHPTVSCDAFPVVRIQNGRVYTMKISPGRHAFTTDANPTGVDVDVEAGKEYFLRIDYPANVSVGASPYPVLVGAEEGRSETSKLRPLDGRYIEAATCGRP